MNRIIVKSRIGVDGVLQLSVPIGVAEANQEVQITIDAATRMTPPSPTPEEWQAFLRSTAGAWQGDLERPAQGEYEQRDELP